MEMEARILDVLSRYASLERATLLTLVFTMGTFTLAAEREFDAALERLRADGRAINGDGLYGRWMIAAAPPAQAPPRLPGFAARRPRPRAQRA